MEVHLWLTNRQGFEWAAGLAPPLSHLGNGLRPQVLVVVGGYLISLLDCRWYQVVLVC